MIAKFLQAEINSPRFSAQINKQLAMQQLVANIITDPDTTNATENAARRQILDSYRDFSNRKELFAVFPQQVDWYLEQFDAQQLVSEVKYIDYSYWNELSDHTRSAVVAARNIAAGKEVFGVTNDGFYSASKSLQNGKQFSQLIVVSDFKQSVVLEGHVRLTAYAMNRDKLPSQIEVIIGYSEEMARWECF